MSQLPTWPGLHGCSGQFSALLGASDKGDCIHARALVDTLYYTHTLRCIYIYICMHILYSACVSIYIYIICVYRYIYTFILCIYRITYRVHASGCRVNILRSRSCSGSLHLLVLYLEQSCVHVKVHSYIFSK